jgi:hypothetical protein
MIRDYISFYLSLDKVLCGMRPESHMNVICGQLGMARLLRLFSPSIENRFQFLGEKLIV